MKEFLATCILLEGMLDWFNLKDVRLTEEEGKTFSSILSQKVGKAFCYFKK